MNQHTKLILVSSVSFVAGALATAAVSSYVGRRNIDQSVANNAYAVASRAQLEVRHLEALRRGDTDRVISQLELLLASLTGQLANYEDEVPASLRHPLVYSSMAEVRTYREVHPFDFDYSQQRAAHEKALGLGAKVKNPADK